MPDYEFPRRTLRLVWNREEARRAKEVSAPEGAVLGRTSGIRGEEEIRLAFGDRLRGLYISGKPRSGKSTAMLNLVLDDFRCGRSACVIDPHGELITAILERLPVRTVRDAGRICVFDPTNLDQPIGIDLLAATTPFEEDRAVQFMIELIERLTPEFARGPILYQAVRNGMRLLFDTGGYLTDLPELLTNRDFLGSRITGVRDPLLRRYWEDTWPKLMKSSDGGSFPAYITSKFSQFLEDRCLRNVFGQRGGLDFRKAIDSEKLLLFDLARGKLGALSSQFLGLVVLHCVERAVMRAPIAAPRMAAMRGPRGSGMDTRLDQTTGGDRPQEQVARRLGRMFDDLTNPGLAASVGSSEIAGGDGHTAVGARWMDYCRFSAGGRTMSPRALCR